MTFKTVTMALATTTLVALGSLALAQDKTGTNLSKQAVGESVLDTIAAAQETYAIGRRMHKPFVVAAAAQMMLSVDAEDVARDVEQKAAEGADTAEEGEGVDAPVSGEEMLAMAKEMAAGDDAMLALIEDIEAEGARGRIGGASRTLSRLPAGYQDSWVIPYYGNSFAELAVVGDGDADLDLLVTDENGNTICYDTSYSDQLYCSWTPLWNGNFYVTVTNMGRVRNSYYLLTN